MLDVVKELKEKGVNTVYFVATFALFSEGYQQFLRSISK